MSNNTIVVTGGAGMIGSNVSRRLSSLGYDVVIVDDLDDQRKIENIKDINFQDYLDKDDFLKILKDKKQNKKFRKVRSIVHNGAVSYTTATDSKLVMKLNYEYSKEIFKFCLKHKIQFLYASSASVYGKNKETLETKENENPLNLYAFSKLAFDNFIRRETKDFTANETQVVGMRYFNAYGPGEHHKDNQYSPFYRYYKSYKETGSIKMIHGDDGTGLNSIYHSRDFIYTEDVVDVTLWFILNKEKSGIFNVGSGITETFDSVAKVAQKNLEGAPPITYDKFPDHLKGKCQQFTLANIGSLRAAGYTRSMTGIEDGCKKYYYQLNNGRK
jgi:ADP-L-glycero-D-manno-heptose 6-epimerase